MKNKKFLELITDIIELSFYKLILKQRLYILRKCDKKIKKYKYKLSFHERYRSEITKETTELIKKGTYM